MFDKTLFLIFLAIINYSIVTAQVISDSTKTDHKIARVGDEMQYNVGNGKTLVYCRPKQFGFIRNLPGDAAGIVSAAFKKESIKPWLVVAGTTGVLLLSDQAIADGVIQFSQNIHLRPE